MSWFLAKIANRFAVDLDAETRSLMQHGSEWPAETVEKDRRELIAGLCALDRGLSAAKRSLDLGEALER